MPQSTSIPVLPSPNPSPQHQPTSFIDEIITTQNQTKETTQSVVHVSNHPSSHKSSLSIHSAFDQSENNGSVNGAIVLQQSSLTESDHEDKFESDVRIELEDFFDAVSDRESTSLHSPSKALHTAGDLERNDVEISEYKDLRVIIHYPDQQMVCYCVSLTGALPEITSL